MEKFVMAAGCALRISDSGKPGGRHKNPAGAEVAGTEGEDSPNSVAEQTGDDDSSEWGEMQYRTADRATSGSAPARCEPAGSAGAVPECEPADITIVLLHGYLESLDVWDDFTGLLAPHMRVIALDLPGHGISEVKGEVHTMEFLADTVHAVLELCNVRKCVVCGHSMGGYVALEFLRKYPEATAGIILFHSVPYADTEEKRGNRRREIEIVLAGKKDLIAATTSKSFAPANRKRFTRAIEELADQAFLTDDDGVLALLRGMGERRDTNSVLSESTVPKMFIFGRGDEYISADVAADMIARHPEAQVLWLENSGHIGFIEEPEKSAQAVIQFCGGAFRL